MWPLSFATTLLFCNLSQATVHVRAFVTSCLTCQHSKPCLQAHAAFLAFPAAAALPALEPLRQACVCAAREAAFNDCPSARENAVLHALRALCAGGSVDVSVRCCCGIIVYRSTGCCLATGKHWEVTEASVMS